MNLITETETKVVDIKYKKGIDKYPSGLYCYVYPDNIEYFVKWMKENCLSSELLFIVENGVVVYQVYIKDDDECVAFLMRWT